MLSVTVKTVKQLTVKIEVGQTATALDLKGHIQETLGAEFPAENQKLIFKGKILQDTAIIGEIGLTETSFVVVMVSKPKPAPVPVPLAPPAPSSPPQAPAPPEDPPVPEGATGDTQQTTEQMVDNLMEMTGNTMPRAHVTEVLTRCQNNPIIAGAMLSGGIEDLGGAQEPQGAGIGTGVPSGGGVNPLEFLRSQPQFQQLRTVLQANPQALTAVLSQMQESNPQLFELINSNQTEFMQLMNDPAIDPPGTTGGQGAALGGQGGQPLPPGAISVTPTEMEAINRLKALGFPEQMVVQAYFACDKNEEMAANFLLTDDNN